MALVARFDLAPTTMPVECIGAFAPCCLGQQLEFAVDPATSVMFCNVRLPARHCSLFPAPEQRNSALLLPRACFDPGCAE